jgi:vacuolar-type H+-ATPase subunit I/STV1
MRAKTLDYPNFFPFHLPVIFVFYTDHIKFKILEVIQPMKTLPAIIAALAITVVIGVAMIAIGANALLNPNTVPVANAAAGGSVTTVSLTADQQQVEQMQSLIQQYRDREKQYQAQLQQATQRLQQANQQLQQANQAIQQDGQQVQVYQQILIDLQQRGVITITNDGQIILQGTHGDN